LSQHVEGRVHIVTIIIASPRLHEDFTILL
jgi:hypothetical protein